MIKYLVLSLVSALGLRGEIEFAGFFSMPKETSFTLIDSTSHSSSGWLKLGQSFSGYELTSFDRAEGILVLTKGSGAIRLRLRDSKVKEGRSIIKGTIALAPGEKLEGVQATLFLDEEVSFPVKTGTTLVLKAQRMPDGNLLYLSRFEVRQKDGSIQKIAFPGMMQRPGESFRMQTDGMGYEFKPQ